MRVLNLRDFNLKNDKQYFFCISNHNAMQIHKIRENNTLLIHESCLELDGFHHHLLDSAVYIFLKAELLYETLSVCLSFYTHLFLLIAQLPQTFNNRRHNVQMFK